VSADRRNARVVGRPVRRAALLRALRSNVVAAALIVWTIVVVGIGVAVLVQRTGADQPFHQGAARPAPVGAAIAQWWVLSIVSGMLVLAPFLTVFACAARDERARLDAWRSTLVGPSQVVSGLWRAQLALVLLALGLSLPVAGMSLALGGTSVAQLGVGLAGAFACGATASALALVLSCRSSGTFRPLLVVTLVIVAVVGVPVIVHGVREPGHSRPDAVLVVNPLVGVADAAAPRATPTHASDSAARAPLTHLRALVEPSGGRVPPWGWTTIGAVAVTGSSLIVARMRLGRRAR
jgi:hypothetical protein